MSADILRHRTSRSRSISGWGVICAFLFLIALSGAPQLHERFHQTLGPGHECAVTMLLSGACDHLAGGAPATEPVAVTWTPVPVLEQIHRRAAGLEFSLLEHAPPSLA
jgi:hypothetical protein